MSLGNMFWGLGERQKLKKGRKIVDLQPEDSVWRGSLSGMALDEEMKWIDWAQGEEERIRYLQKTWNSSLVIFVYPALESNFF